jgi:hypothetical protein
MAGMVFLMILLDPAFFAEGERAGSDRGDGADANVTFRFAVVRTGASDRGIGDLCRAG